MRKKFSILHNLECGFGWNIGCVLSISLFRIGNWILTFALRVSGNKEGQPSGWYAGHYNDVQGGKGRAILVWERRNGVWRYSPRTS